MKKLIRITTIPQSLETLLLGQPKFMSSHYEVICISSSGDGILDSVKEKEGTRTIPVEMTRNITPLKDLRSVWHLYKIFRKEKPFIVHTHTPKAGTVGMLAAFLAKVPNRLHTNGGLALIETQGAKRILLDFVEKLTYSFATRVYSNSFVLRDYLIKNNYIKEAKISVIGKGSSNGIDTNYFNPFFVSETDKASLRQELGVNDTDYVFVFVGRLVKDKGINEMIIAFKDLIAKCNDVKLVLVGPFEKSPENVLKTSDALNPETVQFIKENEKVTAVGFKPDIRPYLAISDCLVFPSYREGFPNVVMQAGAMGLSTIASNINGCNEIIVEGENGSLIPSKNVQELKKTMTSYVKNGKKSQDIRTNCRAMIKDRFDQSIVWQNILAEYKSLENN